MPYLARLWSVFSIPAGAPNYSLESIAVLAEPVPVGTNSVPFCHQVSDSSPTISARLRAIAVDRARLVYRPRPVPIYSHHVMRSSGPKSDPVYCPGPSARLSSLLPRDAFGVALRRLPQAPHDICGQA